MNTKTHKKDKSISKDSRFFSNIDNMTHKQRIAKAIELQKIFWG